LIVASRRHICIALGSGLAIVAMGVLIFHDLSRAAMQAAGFVGFFTTFVVFHFLDERARQRREKRSQ